MIGRIVANYLLVTGVVIVISMGIYFNEKQALEAYQGKRLEEEAVFQASMPKSVVLPRCADGEYARVEIPPGTSLSWRAADIFSLKVEYGDRAGVWWTSAEYLKLKNPGLSAMRFCAGRPHYMTKIYLAGTELALTWRR